MTSPSAGGAGRRALLVVASPERDLEGLALVAAHLRRHGIESRFCTGDDLDESVLREAPDAVVLDQLGAGSRVTAARLAHALGARVLVLPTAGVFQEPEAEIWRAGGGSDAPALVHRFLAWGQDVRRLLLDRGVFAAHQVQVVGCPRFDLYQPPYRQLGGTRAELLRAATAPARRAAAAPAAAPLLVWTTNTYHRRSRDLRRAGRRGALRHVRAEIEDEGAAYRDLSGVVVALARAHPDWTVLVKVHPLEVREPYERLAATMPNVLVPDRLPIRAVLCHADVLLQRFSTTATEAWMVGKPVIEVALSAVHASARPAYLAGCDVAASTAEAIDLVERYVGGAPLPGAMRRAREAFLAAVYHHMDGRAAERCAAAIAEAVAAPGYSDADQARTRVAARAALLRRMEARATRPADRVREALGLPANATLRSWATWRRLLRPGRGAPDPHALAAAAATLMPQFDRAWAAGHDEPPASARTGTTGTRSAQT